MILLTHLQMFLLLDCFEMFFLSPLENSQYYVMSLPGGHVQPATQEHQYDPWDQGAGTLGATGELCPCFTSRASGGGIWVCLGGSTWPRFFGGILHESWTKCLKKVVKPQKWVFLKYYWVQVGLHDLQVSRKDGIALDERQFHLMYLR